MSANQKKFRGTLEKAENLDIGWQIVWSDEPEVKPGQKISKKRIPAPLQALGFTLDEIATARLAPVVDFKGRKSRLDAKAVQPQETIEKTDTSSNPEIERPVK